jgi:hypothetical protein
LVSALGAEGVGNALVGCISLPVNALGVDLEQDREAVPGAAGDFGGRAPRGFTHGETAAGRRSWERRPSKDPC